MGQALLHSTVKMTVLPSVSHQKTTCMVTAVVTCLPASSRQSLCGRCGLSVLYRVGTHVLQAEETD